MFQPFPESWVQKKLFYDHWVCVYEQLIEMPNLGKKYFFLMEVFKNFLAVSVPKSITLNTLRPKIKITINSVGFLFYTLELQLGNVVCPSKEEWTTSCSLSPKGMPEGLKKCLLHVLDHLEQFGWMIFWGKSNYLYGWIWVMGIPHLSKISSKYPAAELFRLCPGSPFNSPDSLHPDSHHLPEDDDQGHDQTSADLGSEIKEF